MKQSTLSLLTHWFERLWKDFRKSYLFDLIIQFKQMKLIVADKCKLIKCYLTFFVFLSKWTFDLKFNVEVLDSNPVPSLSFYNKFDKKGKLRVIQNVEARV